GYKGEVSERRASSSERRFSGLRLESIAGAAKSISGRAVRSVLRRAENARLRSCSSISRILESGSIRTTADSTFGGGRKAPFETLNSFLIVKRACNATESRP